MRPPAAVVEFVLGLKEEGTIARRYWHWSIQISRHARSGSQARFRA
jgi:hypothetical protein